MVEETFIKDELVIDIYANMPLDTIAIIIDRPFKENLDLLEYDKTKRRLFFVFGDVRRDLGDDIKQGIAPLLISRNGRKIDLFQMDIKTKQPVNGWQIPVKVI